MNLEGPKGAQKIIGPGAQWGLLSPRPLPGSGWLTKGLETIWEWVGKLWPWPHLTSVGQRESFHPIENWTELVLGLEQLSCECRVVVGMGEEGSHVIPWVNNNIAFVLSPLLCNLPPSPTTLWTHLEAPPWRLVGFPGGTSGKKPACQCRRHKRHLFDPRVRKIPWRRPWQHTPEFLPGESFGQRSVVGYSP